MRPGLSKVLFHLEPGAWHGSATESVWAERMDQRCFRLRNVPFYAFGVSVEDVVVAQPIGHIFEFESVSHRGGHSTYRIITKKTARPEDFQQKWQRLEHLGCTYEQGPGQLMAVDVPPRANIYEVYSLLEEGERDGIWDFEEGHCGHPLTK